MLCLGICAPGGLYLPGKKTAKTVSHAMLNSLLLSRDQRLQSFSSSTHDLNANSLRNARAERAAVSSRAVFSRKGPARWSRASCARCRSQPLAAPSCLSLGIAVPAVPQSCRLREAQGAAGAPSAVPVRRVRRMRTGVRSRCHARSALHRGSKRATHLQRGFVRPSGRCWCARSGVTRVPACRP